ncbi:glutamate--tRNA ligase [Candidatus Micrarchaeota archaeon]|nr:glutamate--tRNA ligase [Candidatus Micrarchaeota archaeon]
MNLEEIARKHALKNALDYGKANAKAVVGKVLAEAPEAKKDMKKTMALVEKTVAEVNKLSSAKVEEQASGYKFIEKKKEEGEKQLRLENAVHGKVVTRFLPEPNGFLHMGHAKAAWLSCEAARQYDGKTVLRWDDTNPEKEKQEFVEAIREDLKWLGLEFDRESFTSDFMPRFYEFAEKLVKQGDAYACYCAKEEIARNRELQKPCEHRNAGVKENLEAWKKMVAGKFKEGEAILRLKADLNALNTVMRDPTLFRMIFTPHYRQKEKYKAWPTYDFEVSISDSLDGVTHALRSKEYELRDELYYYIIDKVGLRKPIIYDFSRLNIRGTLLSKRFLRPLIEEGKVWGWDDPRLPTIRGLRRRGILPEAIKTFVLSFGLSKVESEPGWDALLVENRKLLDPVGEHYFFVENPVKLVVENAEKPAVVKLSKHPVKGGERVVKHDNEFFVQESDLKKMKKNEVFRLKDLYNVKLLDYSKGKAKGEFSGKELVEGKKIQWVSVLEAEKAELIELGDLFVNDKFNENSLRVRKGVCEKACTRLKQNTIIQFERVGFARLDDEKKMRFILSS